MADRERNQRQDDERASGTGGDATRDAASRDAAKGSTGHGGGDYSPNDETRAGHRSFENTSFAADEREQTEERNRVARGQQLDEAGEPPDPMEGRD